MRSDLPQSSHGLVKEDTLPSNFYLGRSFRVIFILSVVYYKGENEDQREEMRWCRCYEGQYTQEVMMLLSVDFVVYYESLKREVKTKPVNEFRCDERLQIRVEESTHLGCPRWSIFFYYFPSRSPKI